MRQIKSFMNLVLHLMKISEFNVRDYSAFSYHLEIKTTKMSMYHTNVDIMTIKHTNGNIIHYVKPNDKKHATVTVSVKKFGSNKLENSYIDLSIKDKVDYFNYSVQDDPGRLTLEDISVLNEIRSFAFKVLLNK